MSEIEPPKKAALFAAIAAAMGDIAESGVAKLGRNKEQGYEYRAVDDIYNVLAPILAKHGLVFIPNVLERVVTERETKYKTILYSVLLKMEYTIYHASGESVQFIVYGEACDSGDKGTNKAMTAALKYALIQVFAIPVVGANADADATTPDETVLPGHSERQKPQVASEARGVTVPKSKSPNKSSPRKPEEPLDMNALADLAIRVDAACKSDDVALAAIAREAYQLWRDKRISEKAATEWGLQILSARLAIADSGTAPLVIKMAENFGSQHMVTAAAQKTAVDTLRAKFNLE